MRQGLFVISGVVACALLGGYAVTQVTLASAGPWLFWLGALLFTGAGVMVIRWFTRRHEQLTPMPLLTGFFLLEFVAGGIFYRAPRTDSVILNLPKAYTAEAMETVMLFALIAWVALLVGYAIAGPMRAARSLPRPHIRAHELVLVAALLWLVGVLFRFQMYRLGFYFHYTADGAAAASGTLRQVVTLGANLPLIATVLIACAYYRGLVARAWLISAVFVEVGWAFPSGERSRLIVLGLALLVTRYYSTQKVFPKRATVIAGLIAMFVVFPAGAVYRGADIASSSQGSSDFQTNPVANLQRTATTLALQSPAETIKAGFEETVRRFSGSVSIAAMNRQGLGQYPTEPRDAITSWLGAVIPRTLLPEKADPSTVANEFGREYRMLLPDVRNSSVTVTIIGDLYGTFGFWWLLPLLVGVGIIIRGVAEYFHDLRANPATLAIYATAIGGFLIGFETTLAVGLLQSLREMVVYVFAVFGALVAARVMRPVRLTATAQ